MEPDENPEPPRGEKPEPNSLDGSQVFTGKNSRELVSHLSTVFSVNSEDTDTLICHAIMFHGLVLETLRIENNPIEHRKDNAGPIDEHQLCCNQVIQIDGDPTTYDRILILLPNVEMGETFTDICIGAKNKLTSYPRDALAFLTKECDSLPNDIEIYYRIPEGENLKDRLPFKDDPRYSYDERTCSVSDYREFGFGVCVDTANTAHKRIMEYHESNKYLDMYLYCDQRDPWQIQMYMRRLDPIKLLKNRLDDTRDELPRNVTIIPTAPSRSELKNIQEMDKLTVCVQETDHNFSTYEVERVRQKIEFHADNYDNVDVYLADTSDPDTVFVRFFCYNNRRS